MKPLLAHKQTEEQKRSNDYARFQFIMAMMNLDFMMVRSLLKKESRFLGWMNTWQFSGWLQKEFKKIGAHGFHSRFKEQICLDICPGAEMFVFEYAKMSEDDFLEGVNPLSNNEEEIFNTSKSLKICFVLMFEDGKISDIRIPKKGIDVTKMKKLQAEN
jgi:hypothetical protein